MNQRSLYKNLSKGIFILFTLAPISLGVCYAFLYSFGLTGIINDGFTFTHWDKTLTQVPFYKALGYSLFVASMTMLISVTAALLIVMNWIGDLKKGWLSYIVYLPLAFPGIVMAFYVFQLLSRGGWLSRVTFQLGMIDNLNAFPDLVNDAIGIGIILSLVLLITPFFIILFSNIYKNEHLSELSKLASTLGATVSQVNKRVVIPILLKKAAFTIVLFTIFVMGTYEVPLLLGRQDPSMLSVFVIHKLQKFNLQDIPQAYAMSIIYVVIVVSVLSLIYFKFSRTKSIAE